jgi:hypothetical protein
MKSRSSWRNYATLPEMRDIVIARCLFADRLGSNAKHRSDRPAFGFELREDREGAAWISQDHLQKCGPGILTPAPHFSALLRSAVDEMLKQYNGALRMRPLTVTSAF